MVVGRDGVLNTDGGSGGNDQPMSDNDDPMMDNPATSSPSTADNNVQQQDIPQQDNPQPAITLKVGDILHQLPADCRKVTLNNKKYYVSPDNVFYEEFTDADGTSYRVASMPKGGSGEQSGY